MSETKPNWPAWAKAAFEQMSDQSTRLSQMLQLAINGISSARSMQDIVAFLDRVDGDRTETDKQARLKRAQETTELAKREVAQGFPVLHAQAVVTQWAYLEACIRRLVADWLRNDPVCLRSEQFEKVRVRVAEYERLDPVEKSFFVVDALEREYSAGLQNGVTRFETLLSALGLDGEVPELLRRRIFELGQVRNIFLHRAGIVDKKFVDACPWLGAKVGDDFLVTHNMYSTYARAVHDYHFLVILRVAERFGVEVATERADLMRRNESTDSSDVENREV